MKVWTSAPIGTYVTLKAEKPFWGEERSVQTTKTEQWELLTFDFTNAPTDMPSLAFLFDFTAGSTNVGDGGATSTFYFDEIKFANVPLGEEELRELGPINIYPNPTTDRWTLSTIDHKILQAEIINIDGRVLDVFTINGENTIEINATNYPAGIYMAKITTANGSVMIRMIKH